MNYDFQIEQSGLNIPMTAYKPVKRCTFCQSVYLSEHFCDSCGRSLNYHPIGDSFGSKSYYGIKKKYTESFHNLHKLFPILENKKSDSAKSYIRNLEKRFADLISSFNSPDLIETKKRRFFYAECLELINELLLYGTSVKSIQVLIYENDNSLIGQELLLFLEDSKNLVLADKSCSDKILSYKIGGVLTLDYTLKVFIITTTLLTMAVAYKDIISSQFGK
jgi:hypothetical protein